MSIPTVRLRMRDCVPNVGRAALEWPSSEGSSCFRYCDFDHISDRIEWPASSPRPDQSRPTELLAAGERRQYLNSYWRSQ